MKFLLISYYCSCQYKFGTFVGKQYLRQIHLCQARQVQGHYVESFVEFHQGTIFSLTLPQECLDCIVFAPSNLSQLNVINLSGCSNDAIALREFLKWCQSHLKDKGRIVIDTWVVQHSNE